MNNFQEKPIDYVDLQESTINYVSSHFRKSSQYSLFGSNPTEITNCNGKKVVFDGTKVLYNHNEIRKNILFKSPNHSGIPRKIFKFSKTDIMSNKDRENHSVYPYCSADNYHVEFYLMHPKLSDCFGNPRYYCLFDAIISFLCEFEDLSKFVNDDFPKTSALVQILLNEHTNFSYKHNTFVLDNENYLKTSIKIFNKYFKIDCDMLPTYQEFQCKWNIPFLVKFLKALIEENVDDEMQKLILNGFNPFLSTNHVKIEEQTKSPCKYITGVACVGKTKLLEKMTNLYPDLQVFSRGKLGGYSRKSDCISTVSAMNVAIEVILSQDGVIGDRGAIDNVVWREIMQFIEYDVSDESMISNLVTKMTSNIEKILCDATFFAYSTHKVVIIVDLFPKKNLKRLAKRGQSNDIHRSRIDLYGVLQSFTYCLFARMFNFKIIFTPYDKNGDFSPELYSNYIPEIAEYLNLGRYSKSMSFKTITSKSPIYLYDNEEKMIDARCLGIYK